MNFNTLSGEDLLTLPRYMPVDHHYTRVTIPAVPEVAHVPASPGQPQIEAQAEIQADDANGIQYSPAVLFQPYIPPTAEIPFQPARAERHDLRRIKKDYIVKDGDFYIAYKAFCRECRKVSHTTAKCTQRPARQAAPPVPPPPMWGMPPIPMPPMPPPPGWGVPPAPPWFTPGPGFPPLNPNLSTGAGSKRPREDGGA